jgi:hypothetical protein
MFFLIIFPADAANFNCYVLCHPYLLKNQSLFFGNYASTQDTHGLKLKVVSWLEVHFVVCSILFSAFFEGQRRQGTTVLNPGLQGGALVSADFAETKLVSAQIVSRQNICHLNI